MFEKVYISGENNSP